MNKEDILQLLKEDATTRDQEFKKLLLQLDPAHANLHLTELHKLIAFEALPEAAESISRYLQRLQRIQSDTPLL